ncbi:MAG: prephenate dehydratase, partial [Dehalococcoidia bacterium]|nr:prephenate dehydratase [Dehalococcoidia bacterium]
MAHQVAYLGPAGTFTEEAALLFAGKDAAKELVPFPSIMAVGSAVKTGLTPEGVVPIENSLEGSVNDTLDLLIHEAPAISILGELVLPVTHCLLVRPGTKMDKITVVYSHPQALAQCRRFLDQMFSLNTGRPQARLEASLSTAQAVQDMLSPPSPVAYAGTKPPETLVAAVIGTRRAAELYGAEILAERIQDSPHNATRFVLLARQDHARTGHDKTSLCFYIASDRPGALRDILTEFADRRINLSKIESRPSKE